jgi:hypothetical protein
MKLDPVTFVLSVVILCITHSPFTLSFSVSPSLSSKPMVSSKFTLKQFLNVPGLKAIGLIFTSPHLILPHYNVKHVKNINYEMLKEKGIKCLVFDKDNTLRY